MNTSGCNILQMNGRRWRSDSFVSWSRKSFVGQCLSPCCRDPTPGVVGLGGRLWDGVCLMIVEYPAFSFDGDSCSTTSFWPRKSSICTVAARITWAKLPDKDGQLWGGAHLSVIYPASAPLTGRRMGWVTLGRRWYRLDLSVGVRSG